MIRTSVIALHKKWSFPLSISSVNVNKSAGNCIFCAGWKSWTITWNEIFRKLLNICDETFLKEHGAFTLCSKKLWVCLSRYELSSPPDIKRFYLQRRKCFLKRSFFMLSFLLLFHSMHAPFLWIKIDKKEPPFPIHPDAPIPSPSNISFYKFFTSPPPAGYLGLKSNQ